MNVENPAILVTGCAGLIGSKFCDWLVENKKEYTIVGIDDLSGGYEDHVHRDVIFYKINLNEYKKVDELFEKHSFVYIYHFAAYAAQGLSPFIRKYNYENNLLVTTHLVNCAIVSKHKYGVLKRFVFTSSMGVYGYGDHKQPFTEETPRVPIDPYGIAKLACEMDLETAQTQHGLDFCIIRPHNVYGEKQNIWDKYRNVLGIWVRQIIDNEPITIYGDGTQTRAFTYIEDILEPLWNAATFEKAKNQIINLGGIRDISLLEAYKTLFEITGEKKILFLENRHEIKYGLCSYEKSVQLLDYKMKTELKEGLKKMWEWAVKQPKREVKTWGNYEIDVGIYSYWKLDNDKK